MGMTITIEEIGVKGSESYKIVGTTEANILWEIPTISNESPMGKSILWKKNGDSFEVKNWAGEVVNYKIISVE
jgi:transcription elongation GreA/GreB family factor